MVRPRDIAALLLVALLAVMLSRKALEARYRELKRREAILASLFPEQRAAVADPCRFKTLWTSRRAGKTTTVITDFCYRARANPGTRYVYIALTFKSAKSIAWPIIKDLNRRFDLGLRLREAELVAVFPNGSELQLYGADRPGMGEKLYGQKLAGAAVDEAAFFVTNLEDLIKDYIGPALTDLGGVCYLMSIPGHLPRGLFFHLTGQFDYTKTFSASQPESSTECPTASRWSVHTWDYRANPFTAAQVAQEMAEELEANPNALKDPRFIRNYLKGWPLDTSELVYKYATPRNVYQGTFRPGPEWKYCFGLDLGWKDFVALVVLAYRPDWNTVLVVDTWRINQTLLDKVAGKIRELMAVYPGADIVCDPAHLYIFEQLRLGYDLPIMQAEKAKKFQAIELFNSNMLAGRIQVLDPDPRTNPLVDEWTSLCWKVMPDGTKKEMPGHRNDTCDATLTGWRHAHHYISGEPEPAHVPTRAELARREEEEMERWEEKLYEAENEDWFDV